MFWMKWVCEAWKAPFVRLKRGLSPEEVLSPLRGDRTGRSARSHFTAPTSLVEAAGPERLRVWSGAISS